VFVTALLRKISPPSSPDENIDFKLVKATTSPPTVVVPLTFVFPVTVKLPLTVKPVTVLNNTLNVPPVLFTNVAVPLV
jgi:hypothetical protein